MFDTSEIKKKKKWPDFIRNSPATQIKTIEKAFEKIGLADCEENVDRVITLRGVKKRGEKKAQKAQQIGNLRIVFSSKPWDIATMSMRGIESCQRWSSNAHRNALVGSMIDPYAGIIYLTDGKGGGKGKRMFARAVVRIIADKIIGTPYLFLETVYLNDKVIPYYGTYDSIYNAFASFLRKKTRNMTILDRKYVAGIGIPTSDHIRKLPGRYLSYRDSHLSYIPSTKFRKEFKKIEALIDV
jgi:hypothetical protein